MMPSLYAVAGAAVIAGALAFAGAWSWQGARGEAKLEKLRSEHLSLVAKAEAATAAAQKAARETEAHWRTATTGVIEHAQSVLTEIRGLSARVAAGDQRLRDSTAGFVARACAAAAAPPAAAGSAPAASGADLLAELLGSARATAAGMAEEAERYRAAGDSCERFDAVNR